MAACVEGDEKAETEVFCAFPAYRDFNAVRIGQHGR